MKIYSYTVFIAAVMLVLPAFAQADKSTERSGFEPHMIRGTDAVIAPP